MLPQSFAQLNLVPHWLASGDGESFCDAVCPQGRLCEDGLAPKTIATPAYEALAHSSYPLDPGQFAPFLQRHFFEVLGLRHDRTTLVSVQRSSALLSPGGPLVSQNNNPLF